MATDAKAHQTSTNMVKAVPHRINANNDIPLQVRVSCPSGCDLRGKMVQIIARGGTVAKEIELTEFDGAANETKEFVLKAPTKPFGYTWIGMFRAQEKDGVLHGESSTPFSFIVGPHTTSLAVWDVPSPIALNTKFKLKVGASCSVGCNLAGERIEIYDERGEKVATEKLGSAPLSAAQALYFAEAELEAPATEGSHNWRVEFPTPMQILPHYGASYSFGFKTANPPEHVVTVEALDKAKKTPIKDAYVLLYPYSGYVDDEGVARIRVPKGEYELYVSKESDYQTFHTTVKVDSDVTVRAELSYTVKPRAF